MALWDSAAKRCLLPGHLPVLTAGYFSCLNFRHCLLQELFLIFCLIIFVLFSLSCPATNWSPTEKTKYVNKKLKKLVQNTNVSKYLCVWQLLIHAWVAPMTILWLLLFTLKKSEQNTLNKPEIISEKWGCVSSLFQNWAQIAWFWALLYY